MPDELVTRTDNQRLATLTLNRPDKLNALTSGSFVALRGHLESIATGERAPSRHFEPETVDALERLPQPTVAQIHGHCFTGGLELALACDLLVAAESTRLGDTHGQWGLVPIWGSPVRGLQFGLWRKRPHREKCRSGAGGNLGAQTAMAQTTW